MGAIGSASPVSRATREGRLLSCDSEASPYHQASHDTSSFGDVTLRGVKFGARSDHRYIGVFGRIRASGDIRSRDEVARRGVSLHKGRLKAELLPVCAFTRNNVTPSGKPRHKPTFRY